MLVTKRYIRCVRPGQPDTTVNCGLGAKVQMVRCPYDLKK